MNPEPPPDTLNEQVGILTRREIEARILKPFVAALGERFGHEEVRVVLAEVVKAAARESGAAMGTQADGELAQQDPARQDSSQQDPGEHELTGRDLLAFAEVWEPWFRGGALEIDELERTPDTWSFNVTRCRYAELYRSLGMAELGATLSCNRDAALIEGFGPEVEFERTQTLMEGASCCDFRYRKSF